MQVKDSANTTATKALSDHVNGPDLTVTTTSLPAGRRDVVFAALRERRRGGNTWSITAGIASRRPDAVGQRHDLRHAHDCGHGELHGAGEGLGQHHRYQVAEHRRHAPALTVTTTSLANGIAGTGLFAGAGGERRRRRNAWSIATGSLPDGLSLPGGTSPEHQRRRYRELHRAGQGFRQRYRHATAQHYYLGSRPDYLHPSLPSASQNAPYTQTLTATGGTGGYRWSLASGALPAGLVLDQSGRISGTVTGSTSTFSVQVTDSASVTATKNFTITVAAGPAFQSAANLPGGAVGAAYSTTIAVNGGQPPYTLSLVSSQLPPGLSLNAGSGEISGSPTQAGSFQFTLQVRDAAGAQAQLAFFIVVTNGLTITNPPILPGASLSVAYQVALQAGGGSPPYNWSITAGTLPAGLSFHTDGKIDGTPSAAGSFNFTASVTDANSARSSKDFTLPVAAGLSITTAPQLPPAVPGSPYSTTLAAAGGTAPYVWSIAAGSIPAGLSLNASSGVLAGTPTSAGTYNFTAAVTDAVNLTVQKAFTLVAAAGLTITTPAPLPNALAGTAYTLTLQASGGQTPYSWRITDGALPSGLSLNANSGVISGTPSDGGTFNFTVEVSDPGGLKGSVALTIVSNVPPMPSLSVAGVPATLAALQQPSVDLALAAPYPVAVTGRLNVTFTPANGMPDDPSVQFSSGRPVCYVHDSRQRHPRHVFRASPGAAIRERCGHLSVHRRISQGRGRCAAIPRSASAIRATGSRGRFRPQRCRDPHRQRVRRAGRRAQHDPGSDWRDGPFSGGGRRRRADQRGDSPAYRCGARVVSGGRIESLRRTVHTDAALLFCRRKCGARLRIGHSDERCRLLDGSVRAVLTKIAAYRVTQSISIMEQCRASLRTASRP